MKIRGSKNRILFYVVNAVLLVASVVLLLITLHHSSMLQAQRAAERWQGESKTAFRQISCFVPVGESFGQNEIGAFRNSAAQKLHEAALDLDSGERLIVDAWSTTDKMQVSSNLGSGEASVIAVGGNYFDFHPLRLISGSYFSQTDVMQDRVLLDEDLAWLLFGGTEIQGLSMEIEGRPFVVAGIIERERDFASKAAYFEGMGLYMSYDSYSDIREDSTVSCYELVLPEPVKSFAVNTVKEIFPVKSAEIINNSARFDFSKLMKLTAHINRRSMQTNGIIYPYWENAARYTENVCAVLLLVSLITAIIPIISVTVMAILLILRGNRMLKENLLPKLKDKTAEAVRVRQRRHWEKKHGKHEG